VANRVQAELEVLAVRTAPSGPGEQQDETVDPVIVWFDEADALDDDEPVAVEADFTPAGPDQARAADLSGGRLKAYWTTGPGLAKWRTSPTPWRTLRRHLSKYLSGRKLDATTSAWYRIVFGRLPNG
jgi:hypothetical protein